VLEQSTGDPPASAGTSFAADIIKRARQLILVLRENVTSYTGACLVDSERKESLRDGLICLCVAMCPLDGPPAVIRTDPAPGFTSLVEDELLQQHRINIEIGRVKLLTKTP